ncbi:MAG: hypothetical protein J0L92_22585 [Deltaproteobacteria bacterium]|nr:hypothetical protein [Deltaproteobacteria bacterium]
MGLLDTKHVVALLVRPRVEGRELWTWDVWRSIADSLAPWVARPEIVRTVSQQIDRSTKRHFAFPEELRWTEASFAVWTHGSPETLAASSRWLYETTYFFAPAWSTCVHADESPQIYVEVKGRSVGGLAVEMLLVSISVEVLGDETPPAALVALYASLAGEGALQAWTVRPFIHRRRTAFVRSIDEITHHELDKALGLEALQRESESMDRRCRVTSEPWRAFPDGERDGG